MQLLFLAWTGIMNSQYNEFTPTKTKERAGVHSMCDKATDDGTK